MNAVPIQGTLNVFEEFVRWEVRDAFIDDDTSMLDAAVLYARKGYHVFPAPLGEKKSHKSAEYSNGRNWGATNDEQEIRRDFKKWRTANIGIPTGSPYGFWVVEADTPEGHDIDGIASLKALEDKYGKLPQTRMAISPSGSPHYYFLQPPDATIKNSASEIAPGVDVRGEGGMVLVPPSIKTDVGIYRWANRLPVVAAPEWLIEMCKVDETSRRTPSGEQGEVNADEVAAALAVIPNDDLGWEQWNRVGMATYRATNDSDEGFAAFDRWSSKSRKYNKADTNQRWKSYRSCPPSKIGAGSLFYLAELAAPGWRAEYQCAILDSIRANTSGDDPKADTADQIGEAPGTEQPNDAKAEQQPGKPQGKQAAQIFWHGDPTGRALKPWLVKELIPEIGTGLTSGQWGAGKTFAMLDLAGSVATGLPFAGREIVRRGGVLFVAAEGAFELESRMQGLVEAKLKPAALTAAAQGNPITGVDLDHLPFAWIEEPPHLKAADSFKRLADVVQSAADQMRQKFGVDLALIIIDTLSASAEIDDANSSAENQKIFNGLSALSAGAGAFVLVVDHFGKNIETGTRGSSAKEDHSDVVLAMLADRDISGTASNTRMALRKLRGGKAGVVVPFDLVVVDVVDRITGEAGTSCIIEWQPSHHAPGPASSRSVPKSLKVFIAAMKAAVSRHGQPAYPFGPTGPEVLAVTEAELRAEFFATYPAESMDSKRKTYNRALKDARAGALVLSREIGGVDHIWFPEPKDEQQHGAETF